VTSTYEAAQAFRGPDGSLGLGLGALVILANVAPLRGCTLSCRSCRHIAGGRLRNFCRHPACYRAWTKISWLSPRHVQLTWITLGTLVLAACTPCSWPAGHLRSQVLQLGTGCGYD
jgi:hypothetical protein